MPSSWHGARSNGNVRPRTTAGAHAAQQRRTRRRRKGAAGRGSGGAGAAAACDAVDGCVVQQRCGGDGVVRSIGAPALILPARRPLKTQAGWADESPNESLLRFDFARTPLTRPSKRSAAATAGAVPGDRGLLVFAIYTAKSARRRSQCDARRAASPTTASARCLAGCEATRLRNNVSIANRAAEHPYAIAFSARASILRHAPVKPCCHALRPHATILIYVVALCTSGADSTA